MPITIEAVATEANTYGHPFVGPGAEYTDVVQVDISDLTEDEVDTLGYLKPGVPLAKAGDLVGSGVAVYGVTLEAIRIVTYTPTDALLAADTGTVAVAVGTVGVVNRDIMEDNLGRALTADEIAGFALAGSHIHLTRT
jgi:hypothetical protein